MADKEKLSALMDGEMVDKALIQELELDQESLQTWKNYHVIGDVMRGDAPVRVEWNIAESVALALESEPTHSRLHSASVVDIQHGNRESQPTSSQARRQLPAWLSQFGQVAVAACVSLVVVLGVQQYSGSDPTATQGDQLPVLQTVPFTGSVEPVSLTRDSVKRHNNDANMQEQRRRVNALLQDYELQLRLNSENASLHNDVHQSVAE
ncbi:sigma-E factor negative regulatory protein [Vibrio sp. S12_S33]|uniref:sigma-E factor negative regulatory protein n=1 Tax=Vibrio sp. S12_S33 TaxID=2720223 RepID=UPI001786FFFA|nr:sigma-E factor negative regulatory protein [Vibrio sp. S12_S33]MBD1565293.1 sigma-E factor negative regulatory protein [Vibrio sp. S12_S33]